MAQVISEEYIIVLVGLSPKQLCGLPKNVIGILRTESMDELAQLYTKADVFINPSREESFSLVTVEAMACGTPVIALDTSAPKELISETNGVLLSECTVQKLKEAIYSIEDMCFDKAEIVNSVQKYSVENMTSQIMQIYSEMLGLDFKA